jgi:hypothetical protein
MCINGKKKQEIQNVLSVKLTGTDHKVNTALDMF